MFGLTGRPPRSSYFTEPSSSPWWKDALGTSDSSPLPHTTQLTSANQLDARFEAMFRELRQPILNYLYRLLDDSAQAEEVSQDAFLKAYRALPDLPLSANSRAWMYRIATNCAYDLLRRRKRFAWLPLWHRSHADQAAEPELVGPDPLAPAEQRLDIQHALNRLPADLRVPLLLYSHQGLTTAEIAEIMHISRSAVKMRLQRARALFAEHYEREGQT